MIIQTYRTGLEKLLGEHKKLLEQFERAGFSNRGDIQNEIEKCEENIEFYQRKIAEFEKAETPDKIQIFCYVIVSVKKSIKNNIGKKDFDLLEQDRYHETDAKYWKPFFSNDVILLILQEFRNKTGYEFEEQYLDGILTDEQLLNIDDNKKNSIVIIDLLSLNEENKKIASRFDTEEVAGVLTPRCTDLTKHKTILSIMTKLQDEVFRVLRVKMITTGCSVFEPNLSEFNNFYQKLLQIFTRKFPIKNQITGYSKVRAVAIGLR